MSDCRRIVARLTPFVDKTLPADERLEVERHLAACPACATAAAEEEGGRTVVRQRAHQLKGCILPPGLRSRCEALARDTTHRRKAVPWSQRFVPVFLTSVLLLFMATALFSLATHRSSTVLAAQLTADHSKCFSLFAPAGAPPVEAHDVEAMFSDHHGWDVHVPPSSPSEGIQLIGARRCLYADGRVPHVMYRVHGQDVSLYMLEGVTREQADLVAFGHRSHIWSRGATTYVFITPARSGDLTDAARYMMQEAH